MIDLAIIGGGPAGLSAGLYATRGGIKDVVLFEKGMPGGQITGSSEIENYPGVKEILSGLDFMAPWQEQCFRFGLKHAMVQVDRISKKDDHFIIHQNDGQNIEARAVIVATGGRPKKTGIKGEDELWGKGVSTCATCDGFFYKNKDQCERDKTFVRQQLQNKRWFVRIFLIDCSNCLPMIVENMLRPEQSNCL